MDYCIQFYLLNFYHKINVQSLVVATGSPVLSGFMCLAQLREILQIRSFDPPNLPRIAIAVVSFTEKYVFDQQTLSPVSQFIAQVEVLKTAKTSVIVENNRLLPPYSSLQRIIAQLQLRYCNSDIIILVFSPLSEEAQTASLEAFISRCRAAESMVLLVQRKRKSFLHSIGNCPELAGSAT